MLVLEAFTWVLEDIDIDSEAHRDTSEDTLDIDIILAHPRLPIGTMTGMHIDHDILEDTRTIVATLKVEDFIADIDINDDP